MRRTLALALAASVAATVALAASGNGPTVRTRTATVNGSQETILTTTAGMTLYYYDRDAADTAECSGGCAKLWPPYTLQSGRPNEPASLAAGVAVFRGADGRQLAYRGHPLYTYAKDRKPGDVKGAGLLPTWHVATPSLQAGRGSSGGGSGSGSSGSSSGSGGYGYGSGGGSSY